VREREREPERERGRTNFVFYEITECAKFFAGSTQMEVRVKDFIFLVVFTRQLNLVKVVKSRR
jgi:hypothetical protein